MKTGLRDLRYVLFDGGKRLIFATTFETDWDPYVEDALIGSASTTSSTGCSTDRGRDDQRVDTRGRRDRDTPQRARQLCD